MHALAGVHLHPQMIYGPAVARVLKEYQLQGRLIDGKVGIARFALRWIDTK
ncbi:Uncharacterised protein [Mycobacteroides abscessus subsp. abscessus]|nr:Uncharacterised protein [Mycobacteroides abscessus subsp. abscessus]